ncbi:PREDICTED: pancreatic triacylglycerol lipase-like [Habropoda laboriosa]|uniref:pancreatic triacylglycerol lipase-like n=1 Tax=Habropoda laboriosa TaxID=597456 RepID=UPI00083DA92D|nr:PREDICTED: pancreatic triacylglycerol lipase-like [Habropoda laboriosa]
MMFYYMSVWLIVAKCLLADAASNPTDSIFFRLYNRNGTFLDVNVRNATELVPQLISNETLDIYIHGFGETVNSEGARLVTEVIALDYREVANMSYLDAVSLVDAVGATVANALNTIVTSDANVTVVHLIGHSLGSEVAGSVGRQTNFTVARITGLDPAGPLFYLLNTHLSTSDADFVDIIHTDMGVYGLALSIGHADFFPNNGVRVQPGCPLHTTLLSPPDYCSHHRSYVFYAESVGNNEFIGANCSRTLVFFPERCNRNVTALMGYGTPPNTRGNYFLTTNAQCPFFRGLNGIQGLPGISAV